MKLVSGKYLFLSAVPGKKKSYFCVRLHFVEPLSAALISFITTRKTMKYVFNNKRKYSKNIY